MVLKQWPEAAVADDIVFTHSPEFIISGFLLDGSPGGWWVYQAIWPLYDPLRPPGLTLCDRLPHPDDYIHREGLAAADVAAIFVERARRYNEVALARSTPAGYLEHMETKISEWPTLLNSVFVRFRYALTLIMLGRYEDAAPHFSVLAAGGQSAEITALAQEIASLLERDGELARARLIVWANETKATLGLV